MKTRELTKISICIALLCISSYISFPLPFTPAPVTAQTIVINLIALILIPKQSVIAITVYILLGICGLPVFSGGTSGIGRIFSPTGGFIIGFLVATPIISLLKGNNINLKKYLMITIVVGMPIIYLFGTIFMCMIQKIDFRAAITLAIIPFMFSDIIKCFAASFLAIKLNNTFSKNN